MDRLITNILRELQEENMNIIDTSNISTLTEIIDLSSILQNPLLNNYVVYQNPNHTTINHTTINHTTINHATINHTTFLENFINNTIESSKNKYKKVIADNELTKIKNIKFNKEEALKNNSNIKCPIYCTDFANDEEISALPCGHSFTPEGINTWLTKESNTCPICRYEFECKEIKEEQEEIPNNIFTSLLNQLSQQNTQDYIDEELEFQQLLYESYNNTAPN